MTPVEVSDRLRALGPKVRQRAGQPGVIEGSPQVLMEICRLLGFANDCRKGSVYLTDVKLARLGLSSVRGSR